MIDRSKNFVYLVMFRTKKDFKKVYFTSEHSITSKVFERWLETRTFYKEIDFQEGLEQETCNNDQAVRENFILGNSKFVVTTRSIICVDHCGNIKKYGGKKI